MIKKLLFLLPLVLALTGCMDTSAVLQVRKDGSADLNVKFFPDAGALGALAFRQKPEEGESPSLLDTVLDLAGEAAGTAAPQMFNPFRKEDLENVARALGAGVTLVRSQKITSEDGTEGVLAVFRIPDINRLRLGPVDIGEDGKVPANPNRPWAYAFSLKRGAVNTLAITPPAPAQVRGGVSIGEAMGGAQDIPGFDRLAQRMIQNARFRLQVQVDGAIEKSNASFPVAGRKDMVVLADVKLATLMQSFGMKRMMTVSKPSDLTPIAGKNTPGLLLERPDRPLQIQFK